MIICPLQNRPFLLTNSSWIQVRPRISQKFGKTDFYKKHKDWYGNLEGHNGCDHPCPIGTPLFAPFHGIARVDDQREKGYGLSLRIRSAELKLDCVLAHLSNVLVKTGDKVAMGQQVAVSGNTGLSTGAHLHWGIRSLIEGKGDVLDWKVENYNNGYYGYWDVQPYAITWKGSLGCQNLPL